MHKEAAFPFLNVLRHFECAVNIIGQHDFRTEMATSFNPQRIGVHDHDHFGARTGRTRCERGSDSVITGADCRYAGLSLFLVEPQHDRQCTSWFERAGYLEEFELAVNLEVGAHVILERTAVDHRRLNQPLLQAFVQQANGINLRRFCEQSGALRLSAACLV
jgi:hypothetical protein